MTMFPPVPGIIAAAHIAARRRVLRALRDADALSPRAAIAYRPERRVDRRYFDRLQAFGAIAEDGEGKVYLVEARLAEHDARRRSRAIVLIGGALVVTAAAVGLTRS